jgi:hypothetical protein
MIVIATEIDVTIVIDGTAETIETGTAIMTVTVTEIGVTVATEVRVETETIETDIGIAIVMVAEHLHGIAMEDGLRRVIQ